MQNQDDPRRWRVSYTGEVQRRLNVILEASMVRGKLSEYNSVIEDIHRRLLTDPEDFGEPRRYLPFLNLHERIGVIRGLMVRYGVHREARRVFVQQVVELTRRDPV